MEHKFNWLHFPAGSTLTVFHTHILTCSPEKETSNWLPLLLQYCRPQRWCATKWSPQIAESPLTIARLPVAALRRGVRTFVYVIIVVIVIIICWSLITVVVAAVHRNPLRICRNAKLCWFRICNYCLAPCFVACYVDTRYRRNCRKRWNKVSSDFFDCQLQSLFVIHLCWSGFLVCASACKCWIAFFCKLPLTICTCSWFKNNIIYHGICGLFDFITQWVQSAPAV